MLIYGILNYFLYVGVHRSRSLKVAESEVVPIDFLIGLKEFLAMDVVTLYNVQQKGLGIIAAIEEDEIG